MIIVEDVHKRYHTEHGPGKWVLQGVSFTIPPKTNVGLIGRNGAGKSTLLRLIGGIDRPSRGNIERLCRVSWPLGFGGGLQGSLTGRQNAKFICRIHGHEDDIPERLEFIQKFAEIGEAFEEPVKTYSSGMQARLKFAISLAFEFDVYISDELTAVGDAAFRKKAQRAFQDMVDRSGLIMVSHQENTLKEFCTAGIWLHEGQAHWFDSICDAIKAYHEHLDEAEAGTPAAAAKPAQPLDEKQRLATERMKRFQTTIAVLQKGFGGQPATVGHERGRQVVKQARQFGVTLMSSRQIGEGGYRIKENAIPVLKKHPQGDDDQVIDLYDLQSQCVKMESAKND